MLYVSILELTCFVSYCITPPQVELENMIKEGGYDSDDFAVTLQPFFKDVSLPKVSLDSYFKSKLSKV